MSMSDRKTHMTKWQRLSIAEKFCLHHESEYATFQFTEGRCRRESRAALRMACRPGDEGTSSVGYNHLPDDLREVVDTQQLRRGAVQVSRRLINRGERERLERDREREIERKRRTHTGAHRTRERGIRRLRLSPSSTRSTLRRRRTLFLVIVRATQKSFVFLGYDKFYEIFVLGVCVSVSVGPRKSAQPQAESQWVVH